MISHEADMMRKHSKNISDLIQLSFQEPNQQLKFGYDGKYNTGQSHISDATQINHQLFCKHKTWEQSY